MCLVVWREWRVQITFAVVSFQFAVYEFLSIFFYLHCLDYLHRRFYKESLSQAHGRRNQWPLHRKTLSHLFRGWWVWSYGPVDFLHKENKNKIDYYEKESIADAYFWLFSRIRFEVLMTFSCRVLLAEIHRWYTQLEFSLFLTLQMLNTAKEIIEVLVKFRLSQELFDPKIENQ